MGFGLGLRVRVRGSFQPCPYTLSRDHGPNSNTTPYQVRLAFVAVGGVSRLVPLLTAEPHLEAGAAGAAAGAGAGAACCGLTSLMVCVNSPGAPGLISADAQEWACLSQVRIRARARARVRARVRVRARARVRVRARVLNFFNPNPNPHPLTGRAARRRQQPGAGVCALAPRAPGEPAAPNPTLPLTPNHNLSPIPTQP